MNFSKSLLLLCSGFLLFGGCAAKQQSETAGQLCIGRRQTADAIKAAEEVLADMHFAIDKADVNQGYIKTRPLRGAQAFEFWRSDNIGSFNSAEANLHTVRRTVEINLSRDTGRLCINCNVQTERLNLPWRDVTSSGRIYQTFSQSTASLQRLRLSPEQKAGMTWVDLGKDQSLAAEILKRIQKQIRKAGQENKL